MIRIVVLGAFACFSLFTLSEASDSELLSIQQKRFEAMVRADLPTLRLLITEDLTYTHTNGQTDSKGTFLSKIENANLKYEAIQTTSTNVRIYGDTGVITGRGKINCSIMACPCFSTLALLKSKSRWEGVGN